MFKGIRRFWCRKLHKAAMWPIHGKYICSRCLEEHPVYWEAAPATVASLEPRRDLPGYAPVLPVAVPISGSPDANTYFTRASSADSRNGFSKKCTSVAGIP
jgi:hypothetical protein